MSEELQTKLVRFLGTEFAKPGGRQCVRVDLHSAQPGLRGDGLRTWNREEQPEVFETLARIEQMAATILQIAEDHADSFGGGQHRFEVRTVQHCGSQSRFAFRLASNDNSAQGGGGEDAPTITGVLAQQMRHNEGFMRMMATLFQSSLGQQARLITDLGDENDKLRKRLSEQRDELEVARMRREERELAAVLAVNADKRKDEAFATLRTLGELAARRLLTKGTGAGGGENASSEVAYIVTELAKTMTPELIQQIGALLTPQQQILFLEALRSATSSVPAGAAEASPAALAEGVHVESRSAGASSEIATTVNALAGTLTPDLVAKIAALLTPHQQNLFLETIRAAAATTPVADAGASPSSTSSASSAA